MADPLPPASADPRPARVAVREPVREPVGGPVRACVRRFGAALAATAALLAGCAQPPRSTPTPGSTTGPIQVRVIAFNDFHGHLEPTGLSLTLPDPAQPGQTVPVPVGGAPALAGLVASLREGAPASVVVSSGDLVGAAPLVSALFRHESTIEVMNLAGLDVGAPGNHEFDAGSAEMLRLHRGGCDTAAPEASCVLRRHEAARFPLVSSNITWTADGRGLFAPYWVRSVGPVKVGFIGATTRATPSIVMPSGVAGLRFGDEAEAINRAAAGLKARGVHALVVTIHEGGEFAARVDWNDPACPGFRGAIVDILKRMTPDVDLVLTAHTHQGYRCVIDGRPVMQATSYGRGVSVADLFIDPATGKVDRAATRSRNLPVLNALTPAPLRAALTAAEPAPFDAALRAARDVPAVSERVSAYAAAAAPRVQRPMGRIGGSFDRSGRTDSSAGRLIADAQWAATRAPERGGARFALMNPGGVRTDLPCRGTPPCEVTYGELFSLQPFGNSLVVMTLSGAEVRALLEAQQGPGRERPSFLIPSAALTYRWVARAPYGQRVQDLLLDGEPLLPGAEVRLTVNSFLAEGGDGYAQFKAGRDRLGGAQDVDAMADWLKTIPAPQPARVTWVD